MVIDTSALLAIFLAEPERKPFLDSILQSETRMISAANVLETELCWKRDVASLRVASSTFFLFAQICRLFR